MPGMVQDCGAGGEALDHRVGVGALHGQVGRSRAACGSERVAVEGVVAGGPGLARDRLSELGVDRALREDRLDALAADGPGEVRDVAGRWLGLRGLRWDDGADDVDAVAVSEVVERVVVGDELALRGRDALQAGGDPAVECAQLREVAVGVTGIRGPGARVGVGEGVADGRDRGLRVLWVVPPVRVVAGGLRPGLLARELDRHAGAEVQHGGVATGLLDDVLHPAVEVVAVLEHDLRAAGGADVGGAGLVFVGVGVGLEQLDDLGAVAADRACEVGDLRGRRDDLDLAGTGRRSAAGAAGQRGDGDGGDRCRPARRVVLCGACGENTGIRLILGNATFCGDPRRPAASSTATRAPTPSRARASSPVSRVRRPPVLPLSGAVPAVGPARARGAGWRSR